MSKLRTKLSKWFLDTAKKLDEKTYDKEMICIPGITTQPIITYDSYHVDKLHIQHMVSDRVLETYGSMKGYEDFIDERIPELLTRSLAEEIMKVHKDEIKKTRPITLDGVIYELDLYICKPTKKEASF